MSERIILQDLVDILSERKGITKKDAETFLRELLALISENIEKDESVKIKDFGTFKLVKVSSRKSVNVNTGEAIEIPPHYKVSFTPDKSLRERVNAPFAHFETVLLEDGVTFEDKVASVEKEEPEQVVDNIEEPIAVTIVEETEDIEQPIEAESSKPEEDELVAEHISQAGIVDAPIEDNELNKEKELRETTDVEDGLPDNEITEPIEDSVPEEPKDSDEDENLYEKSSKKTIWIILAVLLVILLVVGWIYRDTISAYIEDKGFFQNKDTEVIAPNTAQNESIPATIDSLSVNKEDSVSSVANNNGISGQPVSATSADVVTTTIGYGDTMRKLGLKYYGNKAFWIYIYEENKDIIKDPNNVPIGTKLVIPVASKYGIDPNDPESISKARKLEAEVYSRL